MRKLLTLLALLVSFLGYGQSNLPANIGTIDVFKAGSLNLTLFFQNGYDEDTVVVEVWNAGKKLSDSTDVTISGDTVKFTLTSRQLKVLTRESYVFVRFSGDPEQSPELGAKLNAKVGLGTPGTIFRTVIVPTKGIIKVSVIPDAALILQSATTATIQANRAKTYLDSTKTLLDSTSSYVVGIRSDVDSIDRSPDFRVIYEKGAWPNTSEFITQGSSTITTASNNLRFSAGTGVFTNTIGLPFATGLDNWRITMRIKSGSITATTYGLAIGKRGSGGYGPVNTFIQLGMTSGAGLGKIFLYSGLSSPLVATSTLAATYSAGDTLELIVERDGYRVRGWARNLTTPGSVATIDYLFSTAPGSTIFFDNSGRYSVFNLGGTNDVTYLKVTTRTPRNPNVAFVGDSKTQGGNVTAQSKRFASILQREYLHSINMGMGSDRTIEVQNRLPEIIALHPKKVLLEIGSNDIRQGSESSAVYFARYSSIVAALEAAGIPVYHLLLWETSISLTPLRNYVVSNFPSSRIIDLTTTMSSIGSSTLVSDGVHPSDLGHALIAASIISSGKLANDNRVYLADGPREEGVALKSGTGSTTVFTISHNLGKVPTSYYVGAGSSAAKGIDYYTVDDQKMTIYYTTAPPSGQDNIVLPYFMKL